MLKLLSSFRIQTLAPPILRTGSADSAPILRSLSSLAGLTRRSPHRCRCAFFFSDAKDGSEPAPEDEAGHERLKLVQQLLRQKIDYPKMEELGLETVDLTKLPEKLRERLEPNRETCPPHVLQVIYKKLTNLQQLDAKSTQYNVTHRYLDWLAAIPWGNYSDDNFDVFRAQQILDEDLYGLDDVKERILEFIAVAKLRGTLPEKIICLSGPPGVGKTSIGRSIARALNRKFVHFSVGGLFDVVEIKGHHNLCIDGKPGKMVQCLKIVGTANPLVLIDGIDKLGSGRIDGALASALMELLDPEQNANFLDHYLDVPIDLSKVLFVCTANKLDMIPKPLLDRMKVITVDGYTIHEKFHIARAYIEKSTREAYGIKPEQVEVTDEALLTLIESNHRDSGVWTLRKDIEKIYGKVALTIVRQRASGKNKDSEIKKAEPELGDETVLRTNTSMNECPVNSADINSHKQKVEYSSEESKTVEDTTLNVEKIEPPKMVEKVVVDTWNLCKFVGKSIFHAKRIFDNNTSVGVERVVMDLPWIPMKNLPIDEVKDKTIEANRRNVEIVPIPSPNRRSKVNTILFPSWRRDYDELVF